MADWQVGAFLGRLGAVGPSVAAGSAEAAQDIAENILGQAIEEVPFEDGDLSSSGKVATSGSSAVVYFDTPYAVRQHEDMTYQHDNGRKAKYLEDPMNAAAQGPAQAIIALTVKKGFNG